MKKLYIEDLEKNMVLTNETFAIKESIQSKTKDGKPYYRLLLIDKTGTINAQIWADRFDQVDRKALKAGNVVMVDGVVDQFKGSPQLNIQKLTRVDESRLDEYMEASDFDLDELWEKVNAHIQKITDKSLQKFMAKVFADEAFVKHFRTAPGAEQVHHSFMGGLMEHVLEMLDLASAFEPFYKEANFDLVRTGIILHDIGKLFELEITGTVVQRTKEGTLLGHITQSYEFLLEKANGILEGEILLQLKHIILSHHGMLEFGSPVVPMTIEAAIVHGVDEASSKVRIFQKILRKSAKKEGDFSDFDTIIGRRVYKTINKNGEKQTTNEQIKLA